MLPAAHAAELKPRGDAIVRSVDGPTTLTIAVKKRVLKVRLALADAPGAGECGVDGVTTALKGFVKRAPKRLRYGLARRDNGKYLKSADGRYQSVLSYPGSSRYGRRDLATDLMNAEWARYGVPQTLDGPRIPSSDLGSFNLGGGYLLQPARPPRGLWAVCGGFAHLPASSPVPSTAPAPWVVTAQGVTTAIGPITLSPTLAPGTTLTFGALAAITGMELVSYGWGACVAMLPSLQIAATASTDRGSCRHTEIETFWTSGPGAATTTLGPRIGDPTASLAASFPAVTDFNDYQSLGGIPHIWAWQTFAQVEKERISGLITYSSVPSN